MDSFSVKKIRCVVKIVLVIGLPNSGKLDLCTKLQRSFPLIILHISMKKYLKKKLGKNLDKTLVQKLVISGNPIPIDEIFYYIEKRVYKKFVDNSNNIVLVLDNFPNMSEQYMAFKKFFGKPNLCIFTNISNKICVQKINDRYHSFNEETNNKIQLKLKQIYLSIIRIPKIKKLVISDKIYHKLNFDENFNEYYRKFSTIVQYYC